MINTIKNISLISGAVIGGIGGGVATPIIVSQNAQTQNAAPTINYEDTKLGKMETTITREINELYNLVNTFGKTNSSMNSQLKTLISSMNSQLKTLMQNISDNLHTLLNKNENN